jgi:hypothetical protein
MDSCGSELVLVAVSFEDSNVRSSSRKCWKFLDSLRNS